MTKSSKPSLRRLALSVVIGLTFAGAVGAQENGELPIPIAPIEMSEIPARAASVGTSLNESRALFSRSELLDEIETDFREREIAVARNLVALRNSLAAASSRDALGELEQEWHEAGRILTSWDDDLRRVATILEKELERLDASAEVWRITIIAAGEAEVAPELLELANATAASIEEVRISLHDLLGRAFALQGKVGRTQTAVNTALDRITHEEETLLSNLLRRERPPLWSDKVYGTSVRTMAQRAIVELSKSWNAIDRMVGGEIDRLGFQLLLFVSVGLLLRRARSRARDFSESDPMIETAMSIFERPFSIAALIALAITPQLYLSTPPAVYDAIGLLVLIPVLRLVSPLLEAPIRPALYFLGGLYLLDWLRDLLEAAPLISRLLFLAEMLIAIAIITWVVRSKALHRPDSKKIQGSLRLGLDVGLGLTVIAVLATVAGFVRLGVLLGTGVLVSGYLAILIFAAIRIAEAIIALFLRGSLSERIKVVALRRASIRRISGRVIRVIGVAIWLYVTLDLFALRDAIFGILKNALFSELNAGAISLSLSDVLAFGATIVSAILIARFIVILLEEDVYPRLDLGRGVAFAISSVIKYTLITLGFLLAIGAMGIGMDRITILLGAFGVGLGFGLQTIINNFVSGMILVFERPVQVGDSVEVGGVKGRITRIGIRSSTIRTFDGADVTLPNGTLLSDALTNWTMTDRHRRLEVSVGVAYGTDPDSVIHLMERALAEQEGLLEKPAPMILFTGFGESSLDFSVRAWVEDNDMYVTVQSNLALTINRILTENDIEIPFPQRDLHVRSVAPGIYPAEATT